MTAPPRKRNVFVSKWDEAIYLLERLSYWYWTGGSPTKCESDSRQLEDVLKVVDPEIYTQRGAEAWALVFATHHRWLECLQAKEREIFVMRLLFVEGVPTSVVAPSDLLVAAEEYLLFAMEGEMPAKGRSLLLDVARDPHLGNEDREFLVQLARESRRDG